MSYRTIVLDRDRLVAVIRLNRPERMNAVVEEMYLELQHALAVLVDDDGVRCLVLTGSVLERGGTVKQAFCAGADLKEHASGQRTRAQQRRYIQLAHDTARLLAELPKPVIAAVNGPARGAGAELALACDLVLMAEEATLALPELGLGTFVGGGATLHLPRLVGLARARELVYTGRVLDGRAAVEMGLAVGCCPVAVLHAQALGLAHKLAAKAPLSLRLAKRLLARSASLDLETVLELEAEAILTCMDSEDWGEGVRAFAEGRPPTFTGR